MRSVKRTIGKVRYLPKTSHDVYIKVRDINNGFARPIIDAILRHLWGGRYVHITHGVKNDAIVLKNFWDDGTPEPWRLKETKEGD